MPGLAAEGASVYINIPELDVMNAQSPVESYQFVTTMVQLTKSSQTKGIAHISGGGHEGQE